MTITTEHILATKHTPTLFYSTVPPPPSKRKSEPGPTRLGGRPPPPHTWDYVKLNPEAPRECTTYPQRQEHDFRGDSHAAHRANPTDERPHVQIGRATTHINALVANVALLIVVSWTAEQESLHTSNQAPAPPQKKTPGASPKNPKNSQKARRDRVAVLFRGKSISQTKATTKTNNRK